MKVLWVSLYHNWSLQNVQAGVNFIIQLLCIGATFVLVRFFWLRAARQMVKNKDVPVYNLLSLNTVGETMDIIWLLRKDLLQRRYRGLLIQCVFVITVAVVGVLAAFIARFSTRPGTAARSLLVPGVLAQRSRGAMEYATVEVNSTLETLRRAHFPQTQLLEFWPNASNWVYVAEQWNSSWSMDCQHIRSTPVDNPRSTGNCTDFTTEFPPLNDTYQDWQPLVPENATFNSYPYSWSKSAINAADWLVTMHGVAFLAYDEEFQLWTRLQTRTRLYYMQDVPLKDASSNTTCLLGTGPIGGVFFTGTTCTLQRDLRSRSADDLSTWGANPDNSVIEKEVWVIGEHFGDRWALEITVGRNTTVTEGEEIALFYQAYQVTKDTNAGRLTDTNGTASQNLDGGIFVGNSRILDVRVAVPQVSVPCLVICAVSAVLVLAGLINYFTFKISNRKRLDRTPQSKLDWMLETLHQEASISSLGPMTKDRYTTLVDTQYEDFALTNSSRTSGMTPKNMNASDRALLLPDPRSLEDVDKGQRAPRRSLTGG